MVSNERGGIMGLFIYTLAFIGGVMLIFLILGLLQTWLNAEKIDRVEQALEEVTRKRKRK